MFQSCWTSFVGVLLLCGIKFYGRLLQVLIMSWLWMIMETCTPGVEMIRGSWGINQPLTAMFLCRLQRTSMHLHTCTRAQKCATLKQFLWQSSWQYDVCLQSALDNEY